MTGYTRQDTSNNIANGNVVDADDLDLEFNAVEEAFNSSTGHSHDGTSGEGAPITVVGPAQDVVVSSTQVLPKSNNTYDLGSSGSKWKDLHVDGVAYVDGITLNGTSITATAAELNLLDGVTATTAELNILDGATVTAAELNILDGATLTTTELNYVDGVTSAIQTQINTLSSSKQPLDAGLTSIAGLTTAANKMIYTTASDVYTTTDLTAAGRALLDDATAAAQLVTLGLTATAAELNTLDGITSTVSELNILDGVTATTTELNKLSGVTTTATELNYVAGVTSAIQTQINSKAPLSSPSFTGTVTTSGNFTTSGTNTGILTAVGAAATPTHSFSTDPDTGMFRPATNQVGFSAGGTERLRIDSTGAIGLSGANYGTAGQVLTSQGSSSPPTWAEPLALGVGQTWQNVIGSRGLNTPYQNTTGRPIMVSVSGDNNGSFLVSVDGSTGWVSFGSYAYYMTKSVIIPANHWYQVTSPLSLFSWVELR